MLENVLKGGFASGGKKQSKSESATGTNLSDFRLEYAKSGGSKCGVCEEKIKKVSGMPIQDIADISLVNFIFIYFFLICDLVL